MLPTKLSRNRSIKNLEDYLKKKKVQYGREDTYYINLMQSLWDYKHKELLITDRILKKFLKQTEDVLYRTPRPIEVMIKLYERFRYIYRNAEEIDIGIIDIENNKEVNDIIIKVFKATSKDFNGESCKDLNDLGILQYFK